MCQSPCEINLCQSWRSYMLMFPCMFGFQAVFLQDIFILQFWNEKYTFL